MKTLTCKMCGSTYLIKEDDMYLCKSCGTKYSIADIEGENMPKNIKIDPEILKQEAERQEELKRLRKLVKDDPTLYERIFELDRGDWEAYYYHYTVKFKFIYKSDDIDWYYLSQTFDRLKKRVSSDSEIKTCIKNVVYKDFKEWIYSIYSKESVWFGRGNAFLSRWEEEDRDLYSDKIKQLKNYIISIFGENFSDFANELEDDLDKHLENKRKEIYDELEKRKKEKELWKKEEIRDGKIKNIGTIILIIGAIGLVLSAIIVLLSDFTESSVISFFVCMLILLIGLSVRFWERI